MPILFTDANVALSPQAYGVYRLYRNGTLIYIGKATAALATIRTSQLCASSCANW